MIRHSRSQNSILFHTNSEISKDTNDPTGFPTAMFFEVTLQNTYNKIKIFVVYSMRYLFPSTKSITNKD